MQRTFRNQFPEDHHDIPAEITGNPLFEDTSWGNDACPSFAVRGTTYRVRLWVEHSDPALRETCGKRYAVTCGPVENDSSDSQLVWETDDAAEAVKAAIGAAETVRKTCVVCDQWHDLAEVVTDNERTTALCPTCVEDCHRYGGVFPAGHVKGQPITAERFSNLLKIAEREHGIC